MNNVIKYILLLTGLIVPQVFFSQYWAVLVVWIFTGFLLSSNFRKLFFTVFLLQFLIGSFLFFIWSAEASLFLLEIPALFELPGFILPLFATLFNALNAAFCFLAGSMLAGIIKRRTVIS